jgi:hypothetical protein
MYVEFQSALDSTHYFIDFTWAATAGLTSVKGKWIVLSEPLAPGHGGGRVKRKQGKRSTVRKPPVPSENHDEIEGWIRRVMPDLNPIVNRLDEMIRDTIPGLQFAVKWKKAYYGLLELGWILEIVAYDVSVNVVFLGGAELDPPPPLGEGDRTRYVKVKTLEEAESPEMHKWIEQAADVPGWQ